MIAAPKIARAAIKNTLEARPSEIAATNESDRVKKCNMQPLTVSLTSDCRWPVFFILLIRRFSGIAVSIAIAVRRKPKRIPDTDAETSAKSWTRLASLVPYKKNASAMAADALISKMKSLIAIS
jgi:hypothetical protein